MLTSYLSRTELLLQNPAAPSSLYATNVLTAYINIARGQLAGEAECVRRIGTITTLVGQRNYNFSNITLGDASVAGVIHVRRITYNVASGQQRVAPNAWEWFDQYYMNNPVPVNGPPSNWSQYGQGSSGQGLETGVGLGTLSSGSFYLDPPPNDIYTLNCDCVCYPSILSADTDPESIPWIWTDCVPFFAAYYALLSSQTSARLADAERYFGYYQTYVGRARNAANPSVNRYLYEQTPDIFKPGKLGITQQKAGAQG